MAASPSRFHASLRYLGPALIVLLLLEAVLGGWTNVSGPATFTSQTQLPALRGHEGIGYLLGLLAVVALIGALLERRAASIVLSILVLVGVGVAGVAGRAFVESAPNPSGDALLMTAMFVVALAGAIGMTYLAWRSTPGGPSPSSNAPAA